MKNFTYVLLFLVLASSAYCAGSVTLRTGLDRKLEVTFAQPPRVKQGDLGVGWCDIEDLQLGTGPYIDVFGFETAEFYSEAFHLPHGSDLSLDSLGLDLHYAMSTAVAGAQVSMQVDVWLLYDGLDMSTLDGTPDATYTAVLAPPADDLEFANALVDDVLDLSAVAANKEQHSHLAVKITRLAAGDTHDGEFYLLRGELLIPMADGEMISGM